MTRDPARPLRVANFSGFYGDRLSAAREMVEGGPVDVLTGDLLAELTLFLLWRAREKDPKGGYAATFLGQMEDILGLVLEHGIRVVTNAGGLAPAALAEAVRALAARLGLRARVAHVEGDDLTPRLDRLAETGETLAHADTGRPFTASGLRALTANAYLGGGGIAEALGRGADVVVCGRVADASLVTGSALWWFGWARDDWDRLAGAAVAGHVLECGTQATGGNYAFFREVPGLEHPGFPLAEIAADGSAVITKHAGTGGRVSVGTVTAQLVYEIEGPRYATPDVVARFDTIALSEDGPDRVRMTGVRGEPAPAAAKVIVVAAGGYRNTMTLVLTGLDVQAKADLARRALFARLGGEGRFARVEARLARTDRPDATTEEEASALLILTVMDDDARKVGRAFSAAAVELALASYPGFHAMAPPGDAVPFAIVWPSFVAAERVEEVMVGPDGERIVIPPVPGRAPFRPSAPKAGVPAAPPVVVGATHRVPLGRLFGARSGDKAGNANVGVWATSDAAWEWLRTGLTAEIFQTLVPETADLEVRRWSLPNLRALNFVVVGLLGDGASSSTRADPQAKGLAEFLRSRVIEVPARLLPRD